MSNKNIYITGLVISLTIVTAIFFNGKIRKRRKLSFNRNVKKSVVKRNEKTSKKSLNQYIENLVKANLGALNDNKKKIDSEKMIRKNAPQVRSMLVKRLKNRKGFGRDTLDTLMIADKVGMDDILRKEVFNLISKTKQSKQKGHHVTMSDEDHIRHRGLDLLYKESKKGNKKSKDMLVNLLLRKDFPNKYRIANLILKSDEKKRRAVQEELKKKLPKDQHYLLFRK